MRHLGLALLLVFTLTTPTVRAQTTDTVLLEGTTIMYPGATASKCFDIADGYLKVEATSPPGRTGESATLSLISGAKPILYTLVDDAPIAAQYPLPAGSYCVTLTVSNTLNHSNDDPNARPNKQVWLRVTASRY